MRGIKIGSVFAVCGFLLSFVSGLFSHTSIISILLKAIIFAIVFGVLGFLIDIIFTKFLVEEGSGDLGTDVSGTEGTMSPVKQNTNGHLVDITIQDEDLEKSGSDNHFVINDNHQMLNESDYENNSDSLASEGGNGFVPLKHFETLKGLSGKEAVSPSVAGADSNNVKFDSNKSNDELGVLPDMNSLTLESESDSSTDSDDVETDNEFVSSANIHKQSDGPTEIKDASLMAKAISSILSDEDS